MRKQIRGDSLLLILKALFLLVPLMLVTPVRAWAYADPGTGAFMYQAAYAAFLGGSFYFRKLLDRLLRKRRAAPKASQLFGSR
jgi:hypothetical protein